jgi:hypothetical protein
LSLRAFVDGQTYQEVAKHRKPNKELSEWCKQHRQHIREAAIKKAASYEIVARGKGAK